MKILLSILVFVMLSACSEQAVYNMMHERERQLCKEQGRTDCNRAESYETYKKEREEILKQ